MRLTLTLTGTPTAAESAQAVENKSSTLTVNYP